MAKELIFKLAGADYGAAPVKLERKKIYGWTNLVVTDRGGSVCGSAYLSPDDALIIPSGGLKQATVSEDGRWLEKSELIAYSEDGKEALPLLPSSFDAPIELKQKATAEEFLDNDWESVYQLVNADLATAVGDDIYKFEFSSHDRNYVIFCSRKFERVFEEYNKTHPGTIDFIGTCSKPIVGSKIKGSCTKIRIHYNNKKPLKAIIANTFPNQALSNAFALMEKYGEFCYNVY